MQLEQFNWPFGTIYHTINLLLYSNLNQEKSTGLHITRTSEYHSYAIDVLVTVVCTQVDGVCMWQAWYFIVNLWKKSSLCIVYMVLCSTDVECGEWRRMVT